MPLRTELPAATRYLLPGIVAGIACFVFSRLMIAPLIDRAVEYEAEREHAESQLLGGGHEHGQELFSRAVQENFGAAVGVTGFSIVMGVLFAIIYTVVRAALAQRGLRPDSTGLAMLVAAGMFVAIALMPGLKYPANPPGVGLDDTTAARSSAFVTITVISVVAACVALATALALSRRWGGWPASFLAVGGYLFVVLGAMVLLPSFHEAPGPLAGPGGIVLGGFPAELLAEFRLHSLTAQAVMWLAIGTTFGCLVASDRRLSRELVSS
ncbi:CbtA family protein [Mycobacterium sp.]|uniref:CbtA family protein n=1 Tax=Mycobacterium sp. TaxID=1785 RepID=UPI002DA7CC8C|nr:CbtA family protein [Mycobacterium sp.]